MPKASKWTGLTGCFKIDRIKNNGFYPVHPEQSCSFAALILVKTFPEIA
jgi:hypothetical protein